MITKEMFDAFFSDLEEDLQLGKIREIELNNTSARIYFEDDDMARRFNLNTAQVCISKWRIRDLLDKHFKFKACFWKDNLVQVYNDCLMDISFIKRTSIVGKVVSQRCLEAE